MRSGRVFSVLTSSSAVNGCGPAMSQNTAGTASQRRRILELDAAQLCGDTIHRPPPRTCSGANCRVPGLRRPGFCSVLVSHRPLRRLLYLMTTVRSTSFFPGFHRHGLARSFPATSLSMSASTICHANDTNAVAVTAPRHQELDLSQLQPQSSKRLWELSKLESILKLSHPLQLRTGA
ncbi:hypothetical protein C8R44DRAFT_978505 [Mycena epipterygia]|nr:hypothetical protein C8R44DRAFT_978505 [Mycena epipterygia]